MITRKLPCILTDEDILDRGKQFADAEHAYVALEDEKRETNADFKKSMDATQSRITELSTAIRDKIETRDVECYIQADHGSYKNLLIRRGTGETVETFDMTDQERQGTLL